MAYDEDEQIARIRSWWSENWKGLAAGLAVGLAGIFGWNSWQSHQQTQAQNAAALFNEMVSALDAERLDAAQAAAAQLADDYGRTPYDTAARLRLAAALVGEGDLDAAAGQLQAAAEGSRDEALAALARLRLARVRWAQGDADAALALLDDPHPRYTGLAAELRGDVLLSRGEREAAHAAYSQALLEAPDNQAELLRQKLADLADVSALPPAEAPPEPADDA